MFIWFALGFVGVAVGLYQLADWPSLTWLLPIFLLASLAIYRAYKRVANFAIGVIIGWIVVVLHAFFQPTIEPRFLAQPVGLEGQIVGLVEHKNGSDGLPVLRFELALSQIKHKDEAFNQAWLWLKPKVRLSCYRCELDIKPGEIWQFSVKLRPIHGSMNPGGFDYEAWAFQQGLVAQGSINNPQLAARVRTTMSHHALRGTLAESWQPIWQDSPFQGLYQALLYADRQHITAEQWEVLRQTGTIHLMAISGLHLTLAALMGWFLGRVVWRLPIKRFERYPVHWFGAAGAMLVTTSYAMLAGFAIPTQRAWIMVMVGVVLLGLRRKFQPWPSLLIAAVLVLIWHPPSVLAQGFWLSFLAVGLIFVTLQQPWVKPRPNWQKVLIIQLVLSIGLIPALWWFYQQVPLYSLIANLIAVPFVSFIGLPLLLLTAILSWLAPGLVAPLMAVMDFLWQGVWWLLADIATWSNAYWTLKPLSFMQLWLIYIALFLAGVSRNLAVRILAASVVLVASVWPIDIARAKTGEVWLTLLDVGQGQSLVIETANHVLVYDAGPKWGDRHDAAVNVITPYLRWRGYANIDSLLISHADQDHAGGAARLVADWSINQKLTGQVERLGLHDFEACNASQHWQWDGVRFEILSPGLFEVQDHNDYSCVLRVSTAKQSLMVTGDLSARFEKRLVEQYLEQGEENRLYSTILVAGHHGSRFSTDPLWLKALQPELVLFSAGYQNRFGFPQPEVISRLGETPWLNTACEGAIRVNLSAETWSMMDLARVSGRRWFHHRCE